MAVLDTQSFMLDALFWARHSDPDTSLNPLGTEEERGEQLTLAEVRLLSRRPETPAEMIVQLEILCEDLDGGNRCDGLDIRAIRNIQQSLARLASESEPDLCLFRAARARAPLRPGQAL